MQNPFPLHKHFIIMLCLMLSFNFSLYGQLEVNKKITVELDHQMKTHLANLQESEQLEQCRDWIKYAVLMKWKLNSTENFELLYDFSPLRYSSLQEISNFEHGDYRYSILDEEIIAILPTDTLLNQNYIARVADEYRLIKGKIPTKLHVINYTIDAKDFSKLQFVQSVTIKGDALFTPQYGYVEKHIKNEDAQALKSFLSLTDDIVYVKKKKRGVLFSGRKYKGTKTKSVDLSDVAVLYQAMLPPYDRNSAGFSLETIVQYSKLASEIKKITEDENYLEEWLQENLESDTDYNKDALWLVIQENKEQLNAIARWIENHDVADGTEKELNKAKMPLYHSFEAYYKGTLAYDFNDDNLHDNSLEKHRKIVYKQIVIDVAKMLHEQGYMDVKTSEFDCYLIKAILDFKKKKGLKNQYNIDNVFYERLSNDPIREEKVGILSAFLSIIKEKNSYQTGRYYGNIAGTEVGMTLYYTDLVMKLWAFDYKNSAPPATDGFYAKTNYRVSLVHKQIDRNSPGTRSWLSFNEDKAEFHNTNDELYFGHVATKINNRSFDDLSKIEKDANYSSKRFSAWWNNHYSSVADYEPEYHRLNQIQKWSYIMYWLKKEDRLTFLADTLLVETRSLDFEDWYKTRKELKVKSTIDFKNKKILREVGASIPILHSKSFYQYKNDFSTSEFSGGVSLSSIPDFKRKWSNPKPTEETKLNTVRVSKTGGSKTTLNTASRIAQTRKSRLRIASIGNTNISQVRRTILAEGKIVQQFGEINLGEINYTKLKQDAIQLIIETGKIPTIEKLMTELGLKSFGKTVDRKTLANNKSIKQVYETGPNEYIVQFDGSENSVRIYTDKNPKSTLFVEGLRDSKYYLKGSLVSPEEMAFVLFQSKYYEFQPHKPEGSIIKLLKEEPISTSNKSYYFQLMANDDKNKKKKGKKSKSMKLTEGYDSWYGKTKNINKDILSTLSRSRTFWQNTSNAHKGLIYNIKEEKAAILFSTSTSDLKMPKGRLQKKGIIAKLKGHVDVVFFNERKSKIHFNDKKIISIPGILSRKESKILDLMTKKMEEHRLFSKEKLETQSDFFFQELWRKNGITKKDLKKFKKLQSDNFLLADSYYAFKKTNNLRDGNALIDYNSDGEKFQFVLKNKNDKLPRILTKKMKIKESPRELGSRIDTAMREKSPDAQSVFKKDGLSYFKYLKKIVKVSKAKGLITRNEPLNSQNAYSFFNGADFRDVTFYKGEESDMESSIEHVNSDIYLDYNSSIFLNAVDATTTIGNDFNNAVKDIEKSVPRKDEINSADFGRILNDASARQIYMLIQGDEKGLRFQGESMSYSDFEDLLSKHPYSKKDFIYVISNQCDELEQILAESQLFNFVFTSCYDFSDTTTLLLPFNIDVDKGEYPIATDELEQIFKNYPELDNLKNHTMKKGEWTEIDFGGMPKKMLNKLPSELTDKVFGKGKKYQAKPLLKLFDSIQKKGLKEKDSEVPFYEKYRSVPRLKC